ncbi:ATP-binding protein [Streptomyces sp. GESEQ-35]|uniref:ATP-binding protein n=1 Tax=Streptomyces sp. GESEQ-35 TaxID=2812657 RepID=UPI001B327A36|nr:ATP-binding protein [Streptomyces sp. GESEQ-35]
MATVSPPWAYTLHLPHDPHAPGIARATLRTVLAAHGLTHAIPTAELMASELLTNAHLHTAGPYALRLRPMESGRLRVAVWDTDPRVPPGFRADGVPLAEPPLDAEDGRGLHLVRASADSVGVSVLRELGASKGGKLLWAECPVAPLPPSISCPR